jgi:PEGA domain
VRPRMSAQSSALDLDPVLRPGPGAAGASATTRPPHGGKPRSRAVAVAASVAGLALLSFAAWWFYRSGPAGIRLEIRSTPSGAAISLDGAATPHRTPASIELRASPGRIGLSLDGYEAVDAAVDPVTGETARLEYRLTRLLQVDSDPPGARVILDGQETRHTTPAVIPVGKPSALELQLEGYEAAREAVTREALDAGKLFVKLTAAPSVGPGADAVEPAPNQVAVTLSGAYRFAVSGCGANSAASRTHALQVTPPCTLRLRAPDYFLDVMRTVTAKGGPQLELRSPALASVQLRSRHENCLLLVAGRAVGSPPVDLEIAAGTYSATLQCPDGEVLQTRTFEIDAGTSVRRIDEYLR